MIVVLRETFFGSFGTAICETTFLARGFRFVVFPRVAGVSGDSRGTFLETKAGEGNSKVG